MASATGKIKNFYKFWQGIRSREISASLAFYFLTGIIPLLCIFVGVFGKRVSDMIENSPTAVSGVSESFAGLVSLTDEIVKSGGIFLVFTSIYSSVNLFYRFGKCGEILYKCERQNSKIFGRITSFVFLVFTVILFAVSSSVFVFVSSFVNKFFGKVLAFSMLFVVLFSVAALLNLVVCPYRLSFKEVFSGSLFSSALWVVCAVGFTLFSRIVSFDKYGELKCVFALMVYSYTAMQSFTAGVALNILRLGRLKRVKSYDLR
mgnify:CR=1 FL=1